MPLWPSSTITPGGYATKTRLHWRGRCKTSCAMRRKKKADVPQAEDPLDLPEVRVQAQVEVEGHRLQGCREDLDVDGLRQVRVGVPPTPQRPGQVALAGRRLEASMTWTKLKTFAVLWDGWECDSYGGLWRSDTGEYGLSFRYGATGKVILILFRHERRKVIF